jgi:hypothetical protein
VRNLATALFIHFDRLFTFLEEEGVEPTNNGAERILRTAVQWRKISFGGSIAKFIFEPLSARPDVAKPL